MSKIEIIPQRLSSVTSLAGETRAPGYIEALAEQERTAEKIQREYGILPTIGCEVEVSWASLYPELIAKYFSDLDSQKTFATVTQMVNALTKEKREEFLEEKEAIEKRDKPRYEATIGIGIPKGNDGYWEFAPHPAYAWQTAAEEVDLLMEQKLIPVNFPNPLHITLAGIAIEGGGPHLILAGMELLTLPSERIRRAAETSVPYGWARRASHNIGGLRHRPAHKLELGHLNGIEARTLITRGPEDHRVSLRTAQLLGAVLLCRRNQADLNNDSLLDMAGLWPLYKAHITELFTRRGLPNAAWDSPSSNPHMWKIWADCLDNRATAGTPEYIAAQEITGVVDRAEELLAKAQESFSAEVLA